MIRYAYSGKILICRPAKHRREVSDLLAPFPEGRHARQPLPGLNAAEREEARGRVLTVLLEDLVEIRFEKGESDLLPPSPPLKRRTNDDSNVSTKKTL